MAQIPYVVTKALPDATRPGVWHDFGVAASIDDLIARLRRSLADCLRYHQVSDEVLAADSIDACVAAMRRDGYMENLPWDYNVFVNGRWHTTEHILDDDAVIWRPVLDALRDERASTTA